MTKQEIKQRHFNKVYKEARVVSCACGCGIQIKNKDKYGRDRKYINGHNGRKYDNPTQYKREWSRKNRHKIYLYKKLRYQRRKGELILLKGGKCTQCNLLYNGTNACVFDFHHLRDKHFLLNVRNIGDKNWKIILKELMKCKLLCSNCHRIKTSGVY